MANLEGDDTVRAEARRYEDSIWQSLENQGLPPAEIAHHLVTAIRDGRFYILTHPEWSKEQIRDRMEGIKEGTILRYHPQSKGMMGLRLPSLS